MRNSLLVLIAFVFAIPALIRAEPVPARLKQGTGHIFLVLLDETGKMLAAGESLQTVEDYTVTTHHHGSGHRQGAETDVCIGGRWPGARVQPHSDPVLRRRAAVDH